jgi:flagellar hook-associated protein 3 FlgL
MRIATSQMFDSPTARMASLSAQADKLQAQISTGSRIASASDDPGTWVRLQGLDRAKADDQAWSTNVKLAQGLLGQTDLALAGVETQLQRVQEIALAASNGTLNAANRQAYAAELDNVMDELLKLANTADVRGQPVFGGANGQAFSQASDGTVSYAGSGEPSAIPVGDNDAVVTGVTGDRAFGTMFATLAAIGAALADGNPPAGDDADALQDVSDQVTTARASVGARTIRLDLISDRIADTGIAREDERTALDSVDVSAAITELQKTLTVLQATQASFTKLTGLSLFDYLR